jgi:Cu2+-exporting ATPase
VREARVSAAAQCATVRWDPAATRIATLVAAVERAGYQAAPDTALAARTLRIAEHRLALWRLFVAAFCAMQVMMLAAPSYFAAPGDLLAEHKRLLDWGSWLLTLPVMCFSAAPFFTGAWRALRQRRIGMDVPVAIGIAVAFVASTGAAFDPHGPFGDAVYFDSLTMFIAFLLGGRMLEMRARHRAESALEAADTSLPGTAMRVADDGSVEVVGTSRLRAGDRVRVPRGHGFCADGTLLDGQTLVDEALLTGESRPLRRVAGDAVVAGSMNLQSPVTMRVDHAGADTRYEAILATMRAARTQRPAALAVADRWAAPFLWAVLLLAGCAGAVWSIVDPSRTAWVVVSVLIVTCPCALSLAAPSAFIAAAGAIGRRGLLLRKLDALAPLATMRTLFVDKTGTLTHGRLRCSASHALAASDANAIEALQRRAASLAAWSSHPLSRALRERFEPSAAPWSAVREHPGQGIEALDEAGRRWRLGAADWAEAACRDPGKHEALDKRHAGIGDKNLAPTGNAGALLACDGQPLMRFEFEEQLRSDVPAAVQALRADGIRVHLLSGDDERHAQRVADALGLDGATGGLSPEAKLEVLREAQRRGEVVGMLGDGINDAPVLAQADVSFAMGEGAPIARLQADGVLLADRLGDLVLARATARRALRIVRQNFAWAALYTAACVPLALAGLLPPWAAGLGMATSSLFVVANSMRLSR